MKKLFFCVISLIMVLMGCAISRPAEIKTNSNSPGMDLDVAIRDAGAQMGENLQGGTKIALVNVASSSAQLSEYIISRLEAALVNGKKLVVVDRANLDKIREEQGFQLSGEVDDDSAKSIGKLLGAGAIITGAFADLGDVYSLTLKAINIETATVAVSYPADIARSTRIETMLASGGGARTGTRTVQTSGSAPPAAPAAPAPASPIYKIGDTGPAGGIVFYDKFNSTGGWRYLEIAPKETEQNLGWGNFHFDGCTTEIGSGLKNTQLIVNQGGNMLTAARFCFDLEYGSYDDWYLPSRDELSLMYENLKLKNLGDFTDGKYWSSYYQFLGSYWGAWLQDFVDGKQESGYFIGETTPLRVRAIRRF
jgi:hypothetical protein